MDWLKLMNFDVLATVEFGLDTFIIRHGSFKLSKFSLFTMAYGIKAVKRQYSLIPLTPVRQSKKSMVPAGMALETHSQEAL
jgi:hypothetical protein